MSRREVNEKGSIVYFNDNNQWHRTDGSAIEYSNGTKEWWLNGKKHREDGPAIEHSNGDKAWYINGLRHREDGPSVEHSNGNKWWYINGERTKACTNCREYPAKLGEELCYSCDNTSKSAAKQC